MFVKAATGVFNRQKSAESCSWEGTPGHSFEFLTGSGVLSSESSQCVSNSAKAAVFNCQTEKEKTWLTTDFLINVTACKCLLMYSQHKPVWIILSFITLMAQQNAAESMWREGERGREGNDYFQQGFRYRWEKGKLSAGDVHQRVL